MALPTGRIGKAVLELTTDSTSYDKGLATALGTLKRFQAETKKVTFRDMVQGMSQAGKEASASTRLIAGMGIAGHDAARKLVPFSAFMREAATTGRASAKSLDAMASGMSIAGKQASASSKLIAGMSVSGRSAAEAQVAAATASQMLAARINTLKNGVEASVRGFSLMKATVAALGASMAAQAVMSVASFASNMQDLSAETGIGVERLQALNYVAAGAGLTIGNVTDLINQLTRRVATGDDSAVGALDRLGISTSRFLALSPDERLLELATAFGKITNATERTNLAINAFGRSGPRALRLLTPELRALVEEAERVGAVMDEEVVAKAARFNNAWEQAWILFEASAMTAIDSVSKNLSLLNPKSGSLIGLLGGAQAGLQLPGQLETMRKSLQNPLGVPSPAAGRLPSESDIKELDRRVERKTKEAQDAEEAAEKHKEKQRELSERDMQERSAALAKDREAMQEFERYRLSLVEQQLDKERELSAEMKRAREADIDAWVRFDDERADAIKDRREFLESMAGDLAKFDEAVTAKTEEVSGQVREYWDRVTDDLSYSFAGNIAEMIVHLQGFKDGFISIWRDIRRTIAGILADMVADVIKHYIRKVLTELAKARLAKAFLGGDGSGGGGGGGNAWAQLASGFFMNQQNGGGGGPGGTPGVPALSKLPWGQIGHGLLQYGGGAAVGGLVGWGVGSHTGSAKQGALMGGISGGATGFALGGPIGGLIGFGVGAISGFIGGQRAHKRANDLRDQFLMANWGGTSAQAGPRAAAWLTRTTREPNGGALYAALMKARTQDQVREVEAAIASVASRATPPKAIKMYTLGGHVAPGVIQPAILHGGAYGEDIIPRKRAQDRPSDQMTHQRPQIVVNAPMYVQGILSAETADEVHRKHLRGLINDSILMNKGGTATVIRRAVGSRASSVRAAAGLGGLF